MLSRVVLYAVSVVSAAKRGRNKCAVSAAKLVINPKLHLQTLKYLYSSLTRGERSPARKTAKSYNVCKCSWGLITHLAAHTTHLYPT